MDNQASALESTPDPGKWIGRLVAAVILAEGIWGFLASLTSNLLLPLLSRVMDANPQSPLYLGKGVLNIPALFTSGLALCLAGIVFVLLHEWSRRPAVARVKVVRVVRKTSQPAAGSLSISAPPAPVAAPSETTAAPISAQPTPQAALVPPASVTQPAKPAPPPILTPRKPAKAKDVYYNIVGEPINPTEND